MIGKHAKDFQTYFLIIKSQISEMLIACSLLSRMKLMTWKETKLLCELTAKWYFFNLKSLHVACMLFAKENDRLVFLMPYYRDHTDVVKIGNVNSTEDNT